MFAGISPAQAKQADTDCYYYYYSACEKGDDCCFRHEPSALGREIVCEHWLKGNCNKVRCPLRHMKITKKRDVIPCFYEKQPGGCTKPHCTFLHGAETKKRDEIPCVHESRPGGCTKPQCPFQHVLSGKIQSSPRKNGVSPGNWKNGPSAQLRNLSLNPRKTNSPLKNHKNQGISKTKDKFKGSTRQAASLGNLSMPEIGQVSPNDLVKCLSQNRNFSSKIRILSLSLKCKEPQVKQTVFKYESIFVVRKDSVFLRPKLKICYKYAVDDDCDGIQQCMRLHVCPMFVFSNCNDSNCLLGHVLKTNHNKRIYEYFCIDGLSTFTLLSLLRAIGPSVWAMEDNVKICEDYNDGNCSDDVCQMLHICLAFLANQCLVEADCKLNHDFSNGSIITILKSHGIVLNESPKDSMSSIINGFVVKDQIQYFQKSDKRNSLPAIRGDNFMQIGTNVLDSQALPTITTTWSHHFYGETSQDEICFDSVEGLCQLEESGCPKLHSTQHFHWQVKEEGQKWVNLRSEQVTALEKAYCDPEITEVDLPPLDPTTLDSSVKGLITLMQGRKKWRTNFDKMQMSFSDSRSLSLRRICTRTISGGTTPDPCRFSWYFLDMQNKWIKYGNVDSTGKYKCSCSSDDVEKHYQLTKDTPMIVSSPKFSYSLDFINMLQTNISTGVRRKIKRRPIPHLIVENTSWAQNEFPSYWESMQPQERAKRVLLNPNSEEYIKILNHFTNKGGPRSVHKIERVQNTYLWRTFQNKVQEMTSIYTNKDIVNIQQLFHGTKADVVDNICKENFDWRLHGSSTGQAYGRGTYFSPFASTSNRYTSPDSYGYKYMFVAQVAVGTIINGSRSMVRPPLNPSTNVLYDSSVDRVASPSIIVKYDKQEYYPEYILTFQ